MPYYDTYKAEEIIVINAAVTIDLNLGMIENTGCEKDIPFKRVMEFSYTAHQAGTASVVVVVKVAAPVAGEEYRMTVQGSIPLNGVAPTDPATPGTLRSYEVVAATGETQTSLMDKFETLINADPGAYFTSANVAGTLTITHDSTGGYNLAAQLGTTWDATDTNTPTLGNKSLGQGTDLAVIYPDAGFAAATDYDKWEIVWWEPTATEDNFDNSEIIRRTCVLYIQDDGGAIDAENTTLTAIFDGTFVGGLADYVGMQSN